VIALTRIEPHALTDEAALAKEETMTKIRDVADIRMQSQLNEEDRRAIRRSKLMALIGVAAVAAAALFPAAEESGPRTAGVVSNVAPASPAASTERPAFAAGSFAPQFTSPASEKVETSSY